MNRIHVIGRLGVFLAGLAGSLLAFWAGTVPAAFAAVVAPLGGDPRGRPGLPYHKHPPLPAHAHTLVTGGMPGWQIALIAAGAALLGAALAVIAYRMRAARRRVTVRTA